jgi:CheY-like chemotaxis protein
MMTILVVGAPAAEASRYAEAHPSVEVLAASGNDEALEKLARNRRIDAVLLLPGSEAGELAAELAEEDPSAPPLFAPASVGAIPGVRALAAEDPERLLELVVQALDSA